MSSILRQVRHLASKGEIRISEHGYEQLSQDDLCVKDMIRGLTEARVVEEYADYSKGPCVLVLQQDPQGAPVHVVWGVPAGRDSPAVLVTAYRPDPERWTPDFLRRVS